MMDKFDAIDQIQQLAREHNLCVSIVTVSDVLELHGIEDEPTPEQISLVTNSWEWRHFSDHWSNAFEYLDVE